MYKYFQVGHVETVNLLVCLINTGFVIALVACSQQQRSLY